MKTKVSTKKDQTQLTVTLEAQEVDNYITAAYRDLGKKYRFPGFRKGHVPRQVINSAMGEQSVLAQATDDLLNTSLPLAIDYADLNYIGNLDFEEVKELVEPGKEFVFTLNCKLKPEYELSSYDAVEIEVPQEAATEAEIDEQVEQLTNYYQSYENATAATKIKADGSADITMEVTDDKGSVITELSVQERLYELGQGLFPAAFDEVLVGKKKGDTFELELDVAANPCMMTQLIEGRSKTIAFKGEVVQVKKKVAPKIDDAWVSEHMGMASLKELRDQIAESLTQQKKDIIPNIKEVNALTAIRERLQGEAPEEMVEEAKTDLLRQFYKQMQDTGQTLDTYLATVGITPEQFQEDIELQATDTVVQDLALDAWARKQKITVTDEDIHNEFASSGISKPEQTYNEWKRQGRLHIVREGIMRTKALEDIINKAKVTEVEKLSEAKKEPKKKTSSKASTSKKTTKAASADEKKATEKKAADKKTADKKSTTKKTPAKKTTAKKTTKKSETK